MNSKKQAPFSSQAKSILSDAIRNVGLTSKAKTIWIIHPVLENVTTKFANYVGVHSLAANGQSLLEVALADAFAKYKQEYDLSENYEAAQAVFLNSILDSGKQVFCQELCVETKGGEIKWNPIVTNASEFVAQYAGAKVTNRLVPSKITDDIARAMMWIKVLPNEMLDQDALAELLTVPKTVS